MESILKEFWYGNISPYEHFYPNTREMQKLSALIADGYDELETHLSKDGRELLEKFNQNILELESLTNEALFLYAFSLGLRFAAECFFKG